MGTDSALTRRYTLREPVPLEIRYDMAELQADSLWLYPDVYGLAGDKMAGRALAVLWDAGYDTTALNRARLRAAVREAEKRPAVVAIEALLSAAMSGRTSPLRVTHPEGSLRT